MKIIKPQTLSLLTRPFEFKREFRLGVAVIAFLPIGHTPTLLPETAMWPLLGEELPPDQPLDAVIPKTRPEFLAVTQAHAPEGVPAPLVRTGIQLGSVIKLLDVYGDRTLDRRAGEITQPVPFLETPMDWAHTYGGPGFAGNPGGKGLTETADGLVAVQNVLNPKLSRDGARVPASFGPVDQTWPSRAKLTGTYDDNWLKQDFPGFARDIDWRFFNVAQPDQWLPEPLTGTETYAFKNLHPRHKLLKGQLPGIAPRAFLVRKAAPDGFEEVPLTLTTVWFFPHRERLALIHHGHARLAEEDGTDIARIVLGADPIGALRPKEDFHAVMVKRVDTKGGAMHALRDADLVPAAWLQPDPALATPAEETSALKIIFARQRKRAERQRAEAVAQAKAQGLDPEEFVAPLPPEAEMPTLEELPAFVAAAEEEAEAAKAKAEASAAAAKAEMAKQLAAGGMSEEDIEKALNAKAKGPPRFSAAGMRAEMEQQIAAMRVLGVLTFALEAQLARPELAEQWLKAEAAVRDGYRLTAQHQDPADGSSEERSAEIRRLVAGDTAAARALYDLHGADLSGLDLNGIDLSGVCLDGANLAGTSFIGANLTNAVLAHARMAGCVFDNAVLDGANLGKSDLTGASLRAAAMKKAILAGADLTDASLAGADLEEADISETILLRADLTGVQARNLLAMKLSLRGLKARGIVLSKAKFLECDLQGADLSGADLEQAVFLETNLSGIRLIRAKMRKTVFVSGSSLLAAHMAGADLTEANLRETVITGANLNSAVLAGADLSGASLANAVLTFVNATGCRMVAANLSRADLRLGNLSGADMARADLRGANLTGMCVYEANLARARLDEETRRGGMLRTRMRYQPVYQPPEGVAS